MKTVLFLSQTARPVGGVQNWLEQLDRELPARGWRVVVGLAWGNRFHDPERFLRFHPLREPILLDGRTGTQTGRRLAIEKAIRQIEPAVVVPTTLLDALSVAAAVKGSNADLRVLYVAHELSETMLLDARGHSGRVDLAVGVSRLLAALLVEVVGLPKERVARIPYGVAAPLQERIPRTRGPLRIGYVGRMAPAKRPLDLVELCRALDARRVSYHLTVVGEGELSGILSTELAERMRSGSVRIQDALPVKELYARIYPALDCILLFSQDAEALPIVLIEAMAHGVVPVTADFRGRKQEGLINHGETGIVFPVGDLARAARELEALQGSASQWESLSRKAREMARTRHSLEGMVNRWVEILDRAFELPRRLGPIPEPRAEPKGRLDHWLGVRWAEEIRRCARRRFPHADPSEWPHSGAWPIENIVATSEEIRRVEERLAQEAVPHDSL